MRRVRVRAGCPLTHNKGAGGAEGEGAARVQVRGVEGDQHADKVEAVCLGRQRIQAAPRLLVPRGLGTAVSTSQRVLRASSWKQASSAACPT